MSVSSVEDYNTEKESETVGACCSSWVQYEGEWFEAVTVCGGSTVEDYIGNCVEADSVRDLLLSAVGLF
jgi:hypothetical protein